MASIVKDQIFVAWTNFQRRQVSMASHLGFELFFLPVERSANAFRKIIIYLYNSWKTIDRFVRLRPSVVWIQLPQVPLLWVVLFYRMFFRRNTIVIADCHNAMFRPPWSRMPFGISLLSSCNVVLVHNKDIAEIAANLGVDRLRTLVVEDPPAVFRPNHEPLKAFDFPRPWLVFPASFAADEPIEELLQAAAGSAMVSILITGNYLNYGGDDLVSRAPPNVHFLGFLSREDFDNVMQSSDAVIAFTRYDNVQLSVCGEAVGAGKPMLISNTPTLKQLYPEGNVFVCSDDPREIKVGIRNLVENLNTLSSIAQAHSIKVSDDWSSRRGSPLLARIRAERTK